MNPFLRYLADKHSAHRQTHADDHKTLRLRRAGNYCHQMSGFKDKLHEIRFRRAPAPAGELTALPQTPSWI